MARDGDFPSESAGVQFGCVLSDLFPFLSVVARPGSMFASLVGLGALLGLTVGNPLIRKKTGTGDVLWVTSSQTVDLSGRGVR